MFGRQNSIKLNTFVAANCSITMAFIENVFGYKIKRVRRCIINYDSKAGLSMISDRFGKSKIINDDIFTTDQRFPNSQH